MMGHREKLKSGDEWDLLFWRPVLGGRGGRWKKAKNAINRRTRRLNKGKPLYEEWFPDDKYQYGIPRLALE